jgi:hypothetical protein
LGIHYNYKAKRGERAMQKEQKRKSRLASKKLKRAPLTASTPSVTIAPREKRVEMHDINKTITLDDLTNPDT